MSGWTKDQAKMFAKQVRQRVGDGWKWITPDVQKALVAEAVLGVVLMQHRETIGRQDIERLLADVESRALETPKEGA